MITSRKLRYGMLLIIAFFFAGILHPSLAKSEPLCFDFSERIVGGGSVNFNSSINKKNFDIGDSIEIKIDVSVDSEAAKQQIKGLNGLYLLLRAERLFDENGQYHQFTNNYASTVLTPGGSPIENFDFAATEYDYKREKFIEYKNSLSAEDRCSGYSNSAPFYKYVFVPRNKIEFGSKKLFLRFSVKERISENFPEGYYRFQVTVLGKKGNSFYRVNFLSLFSKQAITYSDWETSILLRNVSCLPVIRIGNPKEPKMVWTILTKFYSNGTQGVVSREDSNYFQFASRHIVPAKFILPPFQERKNSPCYNLEPDFPTMFAKPLLELELGQKWDFQTPIPLNYKSGELAVSVENPDGTVVDLGRAAFSAQTQTGATTNSGKFAYAFKDYGCYLVKLSGWIEDIWGNKYNGGGTYEIWVANRLTFATSVKPGTPFEVGNSYPPSVIVNPPCPAQVKVDVTLYRNSSKEDVKKFTIKGIANRFGYFYPREKFQPFVFDTQGEYLSEVTAFYTDKDNNLWMGSQRSGSVVAPVDTPLEVHGEIPSKHIHANLTARGNSNYEGKIAVTNNPEFKNYTTCMLFPFPYYSGDILYIANTYHGDNGIRPILTVRCNQDIFPGITKGLSPFSATRNGYQPQGYPEFLSKQCYGYMSAIRSGLVARFMVAEDTNPMGDVYWQSGGNFAGNQINNSYNGDLPQDIYEFLGGIVYRDFEKGINLYGIYASMGVVIPEGSYANRVSTPLSEPIFEVNGKEHYLFDAGAPLPGLILETGDVLRAGAMIFPPISGVKCVKKIITPSGKEYVFEGVTNRIGLGKMIAPEGADIVVREPGVYEVQTSCEYGKRRGDVVGSRNGKYYLYAVDQEDKRDYFTLNLPKRFFVPTDKPLEIRGTIAQPFNEAKVHYTVIMPGVIMDEGVLEVKDNRFFYNFSPRDFSVQFPNYDTTISAYYNMTDPKMADTVIFAFFLTGLDKNKMPVNSVKRFILRGNKGIMLD